MAKKLEPGDLIETRRYTVLERAIDQKSKIDWDEFEDMFEEIYPGTPMIITGFDEHDHNWLKIMRVDVGKEYYAQKRNVRRVKDKKE